MVTSRSGGGGGALSVKEIKYLRRMCFVLVSLKVEGWGNTLMESCREGCWGSPLPQWACELGAVGGSPEPGACLAEEQEV